MNRRNGINQSKRMLAVAALALCAVALAFPVATACAAGVEVYVSQEGDDGYGTAWFVDPGEWYVAPAAPIARTTKALPAGDGYGTAWFVDPGEWYAAGDESFAATGQGGSSTP